MSSIPHEQMQAAEMEWMDGWNQGPQRLRWNKITLQVGDAAPDFELPNSRGEQVRLSAHWQDRPALILFDAPEEILDRDLETGKSLVEERQKLGRPLVDNSWMLPGEFVIDRQGVVRLAYRYN